MLLTVIVVSEQEPMNPWGRLCQAINQRLPRARGPGRIMTVVVNPALFQSDCARRNLVPMKLGTSHWFGVGVGVGVGVGIGVGDGIGVGVGGTVAVAVAVGVGLGVTVAVGVAVGERVGVGVGVEVAVVVGVGVGDCCPPATRGCG